jgi:hypothetical protein
LTRTIRAQLESGAHKTHLNGKRIGKDGKFYPVKSYAFDEEQEPETNYRTNADGKTVNVRGFDFTAHRKCEECIKWDTKTGYCLRGEKRQPSWMPVCSDFENRKDYLPIDEPVQVETLSTRPVYVAKNPHGEHALHIREKSVNCKLYPKNPQLSAVEIRENIGEEFLLALQQAITTITQED